MLDTRAARAACIIESTSLPDLLERVGTRHAWRARRRGIVLSLDVDPAVEADLVGPFDILGDVLSSLLAHAIDHAPCGEVTLRIDVVGDGPGRQVLHFTTESRAAPADAWQALRETLGSIRGRLLVEQDLTCRAIVEVGLIAPPAPPHVDVAALRNTLGSDAALYEVVTALGDALAADVGHLEHALARGDAKALRQWLHRVSGALGMAEATGLAAMGIRLEQEVAAGGLAGMELAVRRFALDATRAQAWLREGHLPDPLI
ncbi:Hpt domain-containing protein [Luteibacter aegosomatissinici]|uniref:Hpt domain-containing protein n=1 Tax=Luteibacter aegosomatissinici TaxID=2911539 RepID=UPI001FFBB4D6|nr:Hpt domain-containing protein [Luteibacter aegosomatissinici]UPG92435.1 Hpt domain-containing protein [Luteibacter aegosomatissinici]